MRSLLLLPLLLWLPGLAAPLVAQRPKSAAEALTKFRAVAERAESDRQRAAGDLGDFAEDEVTTVLLAYGLCGNGVVGIRTRRCRLVLPRAVLPLRGGALVVAPPQLWWLADADGDLQADARSEVMGGFEAGLDNPEHSGNGLLWGLDHRIHLANDARLLRWTSTGFVVEKGAGGGQWGITHDDRGRCYFNYNEDWLRCDLVPGRYGPRAAITGGLPQLNWRVVEDRGVWPIRMTPNPR